MIVLTITSGGTPQDVQPSYIPALIVAAFSAALVALVFVYVSWKQRWKRWFKFSLTTFAVVLTVFCVWLGLLEYRVNKQRDAVQWVREAHRASALAATSKPVRGFEARLERYEAALAKAR